MDKIMISQPMANRTDVEIIETRDRFLSFAKENNYEVVNTLFTDQWFSHKHMIDRGVINIPLCFLAKSLEAMANCSHVYFAKDWSTTRGCRLEHEAATAYGLNIIYE